MNQPVVIKAILVIQYACAEETNRRRESSIGVTGPDVTKDGKATHMRAMSMGICWVVRGGQDSFFTSDIRRKKRVIRDDTAIQDADPWTIFRRRRWSGKIARSDPRGRDGIEHGLFRQLYFRHDRGIEKLLELGSRNTDAGDSQQLSHELIGEALTIDPVLVDQSSKLRQLLSGEFSES